MQYGINAPIVFEVTDAVYYEKLVFPEICGASSVNTITFTTYCDVCAMAEIQADGTVTDNYTAKLDGGQYYTFDRIKFTALDASYSRVAEITNNAESLDFKNCIFKGMTTAGNSDDNILVFSDSESISGITFLGNTFSDGSQGLYLKGNSDTDLMVKISINNNTFENQAYRGISLINSDRIQLSTNTLNSTSARTDFTGFYLQTIKNNSQISNNKIYATTASGTGLFMDNVSGTSGDQADIFNNMISIGSLGISYAIDIVSTTGTTEYLNFYHNSVFNNYILGGAGIRINTANNLEFKNNNFVANNSFLAGVSFEESGLTASVAEYNNYMPNIAIPGVGDISIDPNYLAITDLHTETIALQVGTAIAGITLDIDEETRQAPPYMGADEFLGLVSWTGTANTDWNNTGNWSSGQVPTRGTTIEIPNVTNYPETNSNASKLAECRNMTIDAGSHVWIEPMKYLTIHENFNQNGEFVLQSDATGNASLIANRTVNYGGSAVTKSELYLSNSKWHYVSSPITNADATLFNYTPYFYWYDEVTADSWLNDVFSGTMGWTLQPTGAMPVGKGYAVIDNTAAQTVDYVGEHNNGDITVNLSHTDNTGFHGNTIFDGWNLVGNPYPSTLNWNEESITKTNIDNAIYVYADDGSGIYNNYMYYLSGVPDSPYPSIALNMGTCFVAPMQSFYVRASAAGSSVEFTNKAREHSNTAFYKDSLIDNTPRIFLQLEKDGIIDQTAVRFIPEATDQYDGQFDALKLYSTSEQVPQIYFLTGLDGIHMSINTLPEIYDNLTIPIGVKTLISGDYKITIPELNLDDNTTAYIQDLKSDKMFAITDNFNFKFYSIEGNHKDRFQLVFSVEETTEIIDNEQKTIKIYSNSNNVHVLINPENMDSKIEIYNIMGQKVYEGNLTTTHSQISLQVASGNYVVKVIKEGNIVMEKIFIEN